MNPHRDHHRVCSPPVQLAHNAKRNMFAQSDDVVISIFDRGPVIKHEKNSANNEREKHKERKAAGTPRKTETRAGFSNLDRVKVKKNIGEHRQRAVTIIRRVPVAKHRLPNLTFRHNLLEGVKVETHIPPTMTAVTITRSKMIRDMSFDFNTFKQ